MEVIEKTNSKIDDILEYIAFSDISLNPNKNVDSIGNLDNL